MEEKLLKLLYKNAEAAEKLGIRQVKFKADLARFGAVKVCRNLIRRGLPSEAFEGLRKAGRLELSPEAAIVSKEFAPLFTDDEVNFCFSLLCEAGYYEAVGISGGLLS